MVTKWVGRLKVRRFLAVTGCWIHSQLLLHTPKTHRKKNTKNIWANSNPRKHTQGRKWHQANMAQPSSAQAWNKLFWLLALSIINRYKIRLSFWFFLSSNPTKCMGSFLPPTHISPFQVHQLEKSTPLRCWRCWQISTFDKSAAMQIRPFLGCFLPPRLPALLVSVWRNITERHNGPRTQTKGRNIASQKQPFSLEFTEWNILKKIYHF